MELYGPLQNNNAGTYSQLIQNINARMQKNVHNFSFDDLMNRISGISKFKRLPVIQNYKQYSLALSELHISRNNNCNTCNDMECVVSEDEYKYSPLMSFCFR